MPTRVARLSEEVLQRWRLGDILAAALKWDESEHPREPAGSEEGGQFTESGGGGSGGTSDADSRRGRVNHIRVVAKPSVQTQALNKVKAGIAAIPEAHAKRINTVPVYVIKDVSQIPQMGNQPESRDTTGLFRWGGGKPAIYIPTRKEYVSRDLTYDLPLKNITRDTVHELGHALDHSHDWELGNAIREAAYVAERDLTARERRNADYFLHDIKEMFAETYTLAYNPVKTGTQRYFGGMKRERAEKVFAEPLRIIKEFKFE